MQVLLVKNTNGRDLRQKLQSLTGNSDICQYTPLLPVILSTSDTSMDDVVASVDFTAVTTILVMHNTITLEINKVTFVGSNDSVLAAFTSRSPIGLEHSPTTPFQLLQYRLAGMFAGDLDFLANVVGHQGAVAKWPCFFGWRARERTLFWSFSDPPKATLTQYQFRGGTRLIPESRLLDMSDLSQMVKHVPPRLLPGPVYGNPLFKQVTKRAHNH